MKIGFSLSQCVTDIAAGVVRMEDVLLITSSTKFPDRNSMITQLKHYWKASERDQYLEIAGKLWDQGRVHQPRLETSSDRGLGQRGVVWMDIAPTAHVHSEAVQDAWESYRTLLTLSVEEPLTT